MAPIRRRGVIATSIPAFPPYTRHLFGIWLSSTRRTTRVCSALDADGKRHSNTPSRSFEKPHKSAQCILVCVPLRERSKSLRRFTSPAYCVWQRVRQDKCLPQVRSKIIWFANVGLPVNSIMPRLRREMQTARRTQQTPARCSSENGHSLALAACSACGERLTSW